MLDHIRHALGKSEKSPEFTELLSALGAPCDVHEVPYARTYNFRKLGLSLWVHTRHDRFASAVFHIRQSTHDNDHFDNYVGSLPIGITIEDNRAEVEDKIGKPPERYSDPCQRLDMDSYELSPLNLIFTFDKNAMKTLAWRSNPQEPSIIASPTE